MKDFHNIFTLSYSLDRVSSVKKVSSINQLWLDIGFGLWDSNWLSKLNVSVDKPCLMNRSLLNRPSDKDPS